MSNPIPGNDDAVKSIRIIVDTIVAAVQSGLAQRESRRAARGQADIRAANAASDAAPGATAETGEVDLSKVEIPAAVAAEVDGEADGETEKPLAKKKPAARKKIAAPKSE
jgi:small subunit ribosomal protein S2